MLKNKKILIFISILLLLYGCKDAKSNKSENNVTLRNTPVKSTIQVKKEPKTMENIGISINNDKIIIEPKKTEKFLKNLAKKLRSEAKKIENKIKNINEKDLGIQKDNSKIVIDINKTQKTLNRLTKELEKVVKELDNIFK